MICLWRCRAAREDATAEAMAVVLETKTTSSWLDDCLEQFRCLGPECEEICCHGWQISVDAPTLVALRALDDADVRTTLDQSVILLPGARTPMQAGVLRLRADGDCPFLREDRLCSIQAAHGEAPMPVGCRVYPRVHHRVDGVMRSALSLSCPEAARVVLGGAGECAGPRLAERVEDCLDSVLKELPERGARLSIYWPLRRVHEAILHEPQHPFAERMERVGLLAQRLDAAPEEDAAAALREFCRKGREKMPGEAGAVAQQEISEKLLGFLMAATVAALRFAAGNARFCALTERVLQGLKIASDAGDLAGLRARCERLRRESLEPFLRRHPEWMERFLWNEMVRTNYPFWASGAEDARLRNGTDSSSACAAFARLALEWAWVRLYLLGLVGTDELTEENAALSVQSLSRAVFSRTKEWDALGAAMTQMMKVVPLHELLRI